MTKIQYTDNYRISAEPGMFAQLRKKCKGKEKEITITLLALGALALTAALSMRVGKTSLPPPPSQPDPQDTDTEITSIESFSDQETLPPCYTHPEQDCEMDLNSDLYP